MAARHGGISARQAASKNDSSGIGKRGGDMASRGGHNALDGGRWARGGVVGASTRGVAKAAAAKAQRNNGISAGAARAFIITRSRWRSAAWRIARHQRQHGAQRQAAAAAAWRTIGAKSSSSKTW